MNGAPIVRTDVELEAHLRPWRAGGERLVLSNGAFDLLHVGHVRSLEDARSRGDRLVVGVNTDESVRASKGAGRPIVPEAERAELVAALRCVDLVVLFGERTAAPLIEKVRPRIHAKGRDYTTASVPEAELVRSLGGEVAIVGDPKDHATTDVIARIRALVLGTDS